MFIIKFIDGGTLQITGEEYNQILRGGDIIMLPRTGQTFKKSSFSRIIPEANFIEEEREKKKNQKYGILHNGIQVMRHFGGWVKSDNAYEGNDGSIKYEEVLWDYQYYPEIAMDCVKTPEEYKEWKNLIVSGQQVAYLPEGKNIKKYIQNSDLTPLAEIV